MDLSGLPPVANAESILGIDSEGAMFKVAEVADRLKLSLSTVYALIDSGELRCYRLGAGKGAIRVSELQLQEFLQERETKPLPKGYKHLQL